MTIDGETISSSVVYRKKVRDPWARGGKGPMDTATPGPGNVSTEYLSRAKKIPASAASDLHDLDFSELTTLAA